MRTKLTFWVFFYPVNFVVLDYVSGLSTLFVCLSVCMHNISKRFSWICMKCNLLVDIVKHWNWLTDHPCPSSRSAKLSMNKSTFSSADVDATGYSRATKFNTTNCTGPRLHEALPQLSQKQNIFAGVMHWPVYVEWAADHFGLSLTKIDPFLTKMCSKKRFLHFRSQRPRPFDLNI